MDYLQEAKEESLRFKERLLKVVLFVNFIAVLLTFAFHQQVHAETRPF